MKVGTKSLLFGAHQFLIHPILVYYCYCKLYGFTLNPYLMLACLVHDWGYWGLPNMDGPEGKEHPNFGANIMRMLCGYKWYVFTLLHSRYMSEKYNIPVSRLCVADKLAIVYTPFWMYCKDELNEYTSQKHMVDVPIDQWKPKLNQKVKDFVERHRSIATNY